MKIAIICDPIDIEQKTWISVYCSNLIKAILKIDKENEYIFFHSKENILLNKQKQVILWNNSKNYLFYAVRMLWKKFILTPYYLKKYDVDIIHELNMIHPCIFDFKKKYKTITTVFDITPITYPYLHSFFNTLWFKFFAKISLTTSDKIIAISNTTRNDIIQHLWIDWSKITTTYLWTDIISRKIDKTIDFNFPFILSVGTLEPRKNLRNLLIAFVQLKEEQNIVEKLVLVGKKGWKIEWLFDELSLNKKYKDDIVFTGFISDEQLCYLYKTCSIFIYPSLYEGFWLPILEAMSIWCPVITSNISSMPEVVWEGGITIDPFDIWEIKEQMHTLLRGEKLRKSNILYGLNQSKKFSWEKCAKETIGIYHDTYNQKK